MMRKLLPALTTIVLPLLAFPVSGAESPSTGIRVHSVGFPLEVPKVATVNSAGERAKRFEVVDVDSGEVVMRGRLSAPQESAATRETVRQADFSQLREPGRYRLEVEGVEASPEFRIDAQALNASLRLVMLGFYGQRCGMAVELEHGGNTFAHAACHLDDGYLDFYDPPESAGKRDGVGGWHDAGDYGKYTVNAGFTHGMLLTAWEHFGDKLRHLELPIPERGGATPDFLDELRYDLEWMLKMRMPDGKVSHKLTRQQFSGMDTMPSEDTERRYFAPWGTSANANFVGSMAQAARVFEPYDADFARRCREAAIAAWEAMQPFWREVRPDLSAFRTGAYNRSSEDDVLWAGIELLVTAPEAIGDEARARLERRLLSDEFAFAVDWDWGQARNLGLYAYLFAEGSPRRPEVVEKLEQDLLLAADRLVRQSQEHAYGRSLRGYYWGVNGSVARSTFNLHAAYRLTGEQRYRDAAFDQVAYLYGRNPFGRSFVTGDGHNPPMNPHHRPSAADAVEAPWPGHLVGGPHPGELDWFDDTGDYAHNENAINWDGALAFALAIFYEPEVE